MRRIQDMATMLKDKELLASIAKEDPNSVNQAYEELSNIDPEGSATFSVDGEDKIIPFKTLRSFLKDSNPSLKGQSKVAPAVPKAQAYNYENKPVENKMEDEYYWDDPERGYEHMNPQSKLDRVLNKKR
jgi:hypothetical protein